MSPRTSTAPAPCTPVRICSTPASTAMLPSGNRRASWWKAVNGALAEFLQLLVYAARIGFPKGHADEVELAKHLPPGIALRILNDAEKCAIACRTRHEAERSAGIVPDDAARQIGRQLAGKDVLLQHNRFGRAQRRRAQQRGGGQVRRNRPRRVGEDGARLEGVAGVDDVVDEVFGFARAVPPGRSSCSDRRRRLVRRVLSESVGGLESDLHAAARLAGWRAIQQHQGMRRLDDGGRSASRIG